MWELALADAARARGGQLEGLEGRCRWHFASQRTGKTQLAEVWAFSGHMTLADERLTDRIEKRKSVTLGRVLDYG